MRTSLAPLLLALLSVPIVAIACSAAPENESDDDDPSGAGGMGTGGAGTGGLGIGGDFGSGGNGPGVGCSADLQSVVDENGQVIQVCPPELGCFGGQCIPACQAAAQSKGSIGCDYYAPSPAFFQNESGGSSYGGACHAVFLANTWGRPAKLTVEHNGAPLDVTSFAYLPSGIGPSTTYNPLPADGIPPGEVAVLFLSHRPGAQSSFGTTLECPRQPAVLADVAVHNSGRGKAFDVVSDTPLTAYDIMPYGGALSFLPSAAHVFPRSTWGTNYYALSPHPDSAGQLWMMLVAAEDGTTVDILPTATLPGGADVPTLPAGATTQITLAAGEMAQWLGADPTGSVLQSNKPIGVWTGSTYMRVSTDTSPGGGGQDAAHQQIAPISALGSEYVGAGVVTRTASLTPESVAYRMLGVVDGTTLVWDPAPPAGAPATLAAGQFAEFQTTSLFSVRAQDDDHPFMLTQYMPGAISNARPGCAEAPPLPGLSCGLGDEEWVIQLPPRQFLQRYVFFTDPTYATTNLVITRVKGPDGFADVSLSCLGTVTGWQPVGASGQFEVAHVDLSRGFVGAAPACETSRHEAQSAGAFGITVWGTDYYASYGYPAGGNIGTINDVVVPPVPR